MNSGISFFQVASRLGAKASLAFLVVGLALPASAQTPNADPNQPLIVGGEEYVVISSLPITINRNNAETPMQQAKVSADGRYRFVGFLNAITQERREADPPSARQLYRLATVQDKETGKTIKAALPIRFEP